MPGGNAERHPRHGGPRRAVDDEALRDPPHVDAGRRGVGGPRVDPAVVKIASVAVGVQCGRVGLQLHRVGRGRRGEHGAGRPGLLHATVLEHDDLVGALGGDREVVGDEKQPDTEVGAQVFQEVEDALLDRHIEGARRLVGDEQVGTRQHGEADQYALEHAARELVRVGVVRATRVGQADAREDVEDRLALLPRVAETGERSRLVRLRADRADGVERVRGVLRHETDPTPAQRPERPLGQAQHLRAVELDASLRPPDTARQQPQHRPRDRRLARTRLPDERETAPARDRERHLVHHRRARIGDRQIVHPQEGGGRNSRLPSGRKCDGHEVLRSHRLMRLMDSTVATVTRAGHSTSHGARG